MIEQFGGDPGSDQYEIGFARAQFDRKVRDGIGMSLRDLEVLEMGCGRGGISCFLAVAGARKVVGIDLNTDSLAWATKMASETASSFGPDASLPVQFLEMDAYNLQFADRTFDVVVADNAFEHFDDPKRVLDESFRILRPGGTLVVPIFSSIYSKHGLHLKLGLKLPWANLFFSERTIVRTMYRLAAERPELYEYYPGMHNDATTVRELRKHRDLNDITYRKFRSLARDAGFDILSFRAIPTRIGHLIQLMPVVRNSILADIYSVGARAMLRKPKPREVAVRENSARVEDDKRAATSTYTS